MSFAGGEMGRKCRLGISKPTHKFWKIISHLQLTKIANISMFFVNPDLVFQIIFKQWFLFKYISEYVIVKNLNVSPLYTTTNILECTSGEATQNFRSFQ